MSLALQGPWATAGESTVICPFPVLGGALPAAGAPPTPAPHCLNNILVAEPEWAVGSALPPLRPQIRGWRHQASLRGNRHRPLASRPLASLGVGGPQAPGRAGLLYLVAGSTAAAAGASQRARAPARSSRCSPGGQWRPRRRSGGRGGGRGRGTGRGSCHSVNLYGAETGGSGRVVRKPRDTERDRVDLSPS